MRQLHPPSIRSADKTGVELDADELVHRTYGHDGPLLRWNMVSTVDGSAVGADGRSGSINTPADHRVFGYLRGWADAVIVGAGTARAEQYTALSPNRWSARLRSGRSPAPILAVVSRRDSPPAALAGADANGVLMLAGPDIRPSAVVDRLHAAGHRRLLLEGGPNLAGQFVQEGLVDELCLTLVPRLSAGGGTRILTGPELGVELRLASILEAEGTLLTRWRLRDGD